jgi:Tol biopolymer transport system component
MTTNDRFERQLAGWLIEDSTHRVPEHLNEVLLRTVATRQRPWWSSLRRWLPVEFTAPPAPLIRSGSWRPILIVAAAALLIAVLIVLAVGSRRPLPPPFGPARNGLVVAGADGDLFSVDPRTGATAPLITEPAFDFGPTFSRDGTKLLFLRAAGTGLRLVVGDPDGGRLLPITPPEDGLDWLDWSPDSSRIAFLSRDHDRGRINIVNADGSGLTTLVVDRSAHQLSWLPPNGTEILFRGEHLDAGDPPPGIFAVRPDGSGFRPISTRPAISDNDYQDVAVSPDGRFVAYREAGQRFWVRVLDLRTSEELVLPQAPGSTGEGGPVFSPDGRSIVYQRWAADSSTQLVVVPADGSGLGVAIGPKAPLGRDGPTINNYIFTPDGTAVIANYDAEKVDRLLPLDGSPPTIFARGEVAFATIQRLAP